jgi:hypothetical protein
MRSVREGLELILVAIFTGVAADVTGVFRHYAALVGLVVLLANGFRSSA